MRPELGQVRAQPLEREGAVPPSPALLGGRRSGLRRGAPEAALRRRSPPQEGGAERGGPVPPGGLWGAARCSEALPSLSGFGSAVGRFRSCEGACVVPRSVEGPHRCGGACAGEVRRITQSLKYQGRAFLFLGLVTAKAC